MNEQNETKNTEEKEKKPVNWKSEIISWIQILVAAAAIAFVLNTFIPPLLPFPRAGAG